MKAVLWSCFFIARTVTTALAMLIGSEDRVTINQFKKQNGYSDKEIRTLLSATVRISCPWATGTGAIVGRPDRLVTAAHIFFDLSGETKGPVANCRVTPVLG